MTDELNIPEFLKRTETFVANGQKPQAAADKIVAEAEKPVAKVPNKAGKLVERALKARDEIAKAAKAKAKGDPKPKPAKKEAKPRKAKSHGKSKMLIVAELLKRTEGCTTADVLKATGWPTVSMPAQAKAAKLKLYKEKKKGEVTRYFGK